VGLLVGLLALLSLPWLRPHLPLPGPRRAYVSPETPVEAVDFLRDLALPVRAFHSEVYGSYMTWASPDTPVFLDTRIELYPPEQWRDYLALNAARYDWEAILDSHQVNTLLLQRGRQDPLIEAAALAAAWELIYHDEQAVVYRCGGKP
jgi:hypothetical protein